MKEEYFFMCSSEVLPLLRVHCCPWLSPGSVPSLAAGLVFGGLAGLGAYQVSKDPADVWISLGNHADICSLSCVGGIFSKSHMTSSDLNKV